MLAPVMLAAGHLGLADVTADVLDAVADRLDEHAEACRPASRRSSTPPRCSPPTSPRVPVILGDGLNGVAAVRAASMLARTARVPAPCGELPDAASQIVACFDGPFTTAYGDLVRGGSGHRSASAAAGNSGTSSPIPYLDPPAGPRLALLMLRDAVPGR